MQSRYQSSHYQLSLAAVVCLLLAATVYAGVERGAGRSYRIQGGKNVTIESYPWIVSLEEKRGLFCGGVVISQTWVVTAAHCIRSGEIFVRAGTSFAGKNGVIHQIKRTIVHPNFNRYWLDYDIALLEMQSPFRWTKQLKPASLATKNPDARTWTTAAGWGILREKGPKPKILQAVDMQIQDWNQCRRNHMAGKKSYISERKICTNDRSKSIAEGDSGGPLTIRGGNKLVGLPSSIDRRRPQTITSIFTSIASLRGWIKQKTGV